MTTMHGDWAEAQRLVLRAVTDLEEARVLLRGRVLRRGLADHPAAASDWQLAEEMTEFLRVVADGVWSVRAQLVAARKVLLEAEAASAAYRDGREYERARRGAPTAAPDR